MDNIHLNAKERLIAGINKACEAVEGTYGSAGGNVVVEAHVFPFHEVINDGKTIVDAIKLSDPVENIGANIVKEVGNKADKDSGDGRKTTMILTKAILSQPMEGSPMEIKRSLDECLPLILKSLDEQTRQITPETVGAIATIASENEKLGAIMQEIYTKIGKDGILELDVSTIPETHYVMAEGVRLRNARMMYPYMANDAKGRTATYLVPKVLITKEKIASVQQVDNLYKALSNQGVNELVIFCDEIDISVSEMVAKAHIQGVFKTLVIKAPTLWKDWLYEDFAKITGATVIDPTQGTSMKKLQLSHLGSCDKIIASNEETTVIGIHDISTHIEALKEIGTDDSKLRLAWLQTKAAILKVGANSETELRYLSLKARDARNASYLALQGGIVAGGGIALLNCIRALPTTVGGKILKEALKIPLHQIIANSGLSSFDLSVKEDFGGNKGFDAKNHTITDMFISGIIDPSVVIKNAITNAISVAGTVLTANTVITLNKETK